MHQNIQNKIKFILVALVITTIINVSYLSTVFAAISTSSLISLANASRSQDNLDSLSANDQLTAAAQAKANDMFANQYFAHNSPSGKTPWDFIKEFGYSYVYAGENLAIGYSDNTELHNAWMNSPSHRENILNPNYRNIGMATVTGTYQGVDTTIVVQEFGSTTTITPKSADNKVASVSSQNVSTNKTPDFSIDSTKTSFTPNKIFAGDVVTFKTVLTGKVSSIYFMAGEQKIDLTETLSVQKSDPKNLEQSAKIENTGDLTINLIVIDQTNQTHTQTIGTLQVSPRVLNGAATVGTASSNTGLISYLHNHVLAVVMVVIFLSLLIGSFLISHYQKQTKHRLVDIFS